MRGIVLGLSAVALAMSGAVGATQRAVAQPISEYPTDAANSAASDVEPVVSGASSAVSVHDTSNWPSNRVTGIRSRFTGADHHHGPLINADSTGAAPVQRGGLLATLQPSVAQQQNMPTQAASDTDGQRAYGITTYLLVGCVFLGTALLIYVVKYRSGIIRFARRKASLIIVIGIGTFMFDWRVLPHLFEEGILSDSPLWLLHRQGWLAMTCVAATLVGLYCKMTPPRSSLM